MERQSEGPTLLDGWLVDLGGPKTKAMLDRLDQTIPWQKLAPPTDEHVPQPRDRSSQYSRG